MMYHFFLTQLFLILVTALTAMAQDKTDVIVEEKMIIVKSTEAWINTGIHLFSPDRVSIKASGMICFSDGLESSSVDANGWSVDTYKMLWQEDADYCEDPLKEKNHAGLIGNIGNSTFFIGKESKFSDKEGTLHLGINDCTFIGPFFNTGHFKVIVKVEHVKK